MKRTIYSCLCIWILTTTACKEDVETIVEEDDLNSRIEGTWLSPQPKEQYLDDDGQVLYQVDFEELKGEITFKDGIITVIYPEGDVESGAYTLTEASGKQFVVITFEDPFTFEMVFSSDSQLDLIYIFQAGDVTYFDDQGNTGEASVDRLLVPLSKK